MKLKILLFCLFVSPALYAQFPEGWDSLDQIIKLRAELKSAIRSNDTKNGANISNGLRNLSHKNYSALMWDERWLVYHWCGRYRILLDEVGNYGFIDRIVENNAQTPPNDSLFELIDQVMYQNSDGYAAVLEKAGLTPQEQFFADIHLQYLLRNNTEPELIRRDSFIKTNPNSKFTAFIREFMSLPRPIPKHYFSLDITLFNTNWQSDLQRTLRPGWGMGFGLYYHRKLFVFGGKFEFSRQKLNRPIYSSFDVWPRKSPSGFNKYTFETGINVLNTDKIRVCPAFEIGWANLIAQDDGYDEDNPDDVPLSAIFDYNTFQYGFSVTADLKMFKKDQDAKDTKSAHYNGIRMKLGYTWLDFGNADTALTGNMLFFALGYQFSGR